MRTIALLALVGCAGSGLNDVSGLDLPSLSSAFTANEADGILFVANTATLEELDVDAGLNRRAVDNILAHRDGADGLAETGDDDLFGTLDELDAVPYVGDAALQALLDYAQVLGLVEAGAEMGYTAEEVAATLELANTASYDELDRDVGLDYRAAAGIVEIRAGGDGVEGTADDQPYTRLASLDAVPYVGPSAIDSMVRYAMASAGQSDAPGCLILSEYIEGSGTYNKAIEVYNCGASPLQLEHYGVCIVRNGDLDCGSAATFLGGELGAGEVHTACRNQIGHWYDPYPQLVENCDQELPMLTFSGNDRVVIFEDLDGDGDYAAGVDRVSDMLGRFEWVPSWEIWSNLTLRRCQLDPWTDTGWYDHTEWFDEFGQMDFTDFGVPPVAGCL